MVAKCLEYCLKYIFFVFVIFIYVHEMMYFMVFLLSVLLFESKQNEIQKYFRFSVHVYSKRKKEEVCKQNG